MEFPTEFPLELSEEEMRSMVDAAMDRIVRAITTLPEQPAADVDGAVELARSLAEPIPAEPAPLGELLDLVFDVAAPKSFNTASPGYLAYIPGGGLFQSAVADLIADSLNRYTGVFAASPALTQLEINVVRWFAEMMGYPETAGGFLTSGGSLANLGALVTARRERLGDDFLRGTIYLAKQAHHSIAKSALLAGFPEDNLRWVDVDDRYRLRPDHLLDLVAADRAAGRQPFMIAASAGTTNTGAVDPLGDLADVALSEELWLHVDAAYGGFFTLTERGRKILVDIERADSLIIDPHKGLFLPYGTGALLVRDGDALRRAHSYAADYMPPIQSDPDLVDFCEISPELSKPFRGLRVWLPFKLYGVDAFRRNLDEKLDLTHWIEDRLRQVPGLEILAPAQLSTVAFAVEPKNGDIERANELTAALHQGVNARKRVHLTSTMLDDRYALRVCVLSFRTHMDRMRMCLEDIQTELQSVRASGVG